MSQITFEFYKHADNLAVVEMFVDLMGRPFRLAEITFGDDGVRIENAQGDVTELDWPEFFDLIGKATQHDAQGGGDV